jgi:TonB family protein
MRVVTAGVILALLAAPTVVAQGETRPAVWLKRPSAEDILGVWPVGALRKGLGGRAAISCTVTLQGALRDCRVVSEIPQGAGFGEAAMSLTPQLLLKPALANGAPVESRVELPVRFMKSEPAIGSYLKPATDTDFQPDRVMSNVPWRQAPSHADVLAAYPAKARSEKLGGRATLDCRLNKEGGLGGCELLREEPQNRGFGAAARALSKKFVGPTEDAEGRSTARVRTQVLFTFAPETLDMATPVIGRPRWTALPRGEDMVNAVPAQARQAGVLKARVVFGCTVGAGGELEGCKVLSEEPTGFGYGEATLALARIFRLAIWSDEGLPTVGGQVRVPIRFDLQDASAPAAPKP